MSVNNTEHFLLIKVGDLFLKDGEGVSLTGKIDEAYATKLDSSNRAYGRRFSNLRENNLKPKHYMKTVTTKILETNTDEIKNMEIRL